MARCCLVTSSTGCPTEHNDFSRVYAKAYDAMYRDKDYEAECDFLEEVFRRYASGPVRSVLDLGCGTGGHALPLARRGYQVCGVDRSAPMITLAREKLRAIDLMANVCFEVADICTLELRRTFDAVICMFAVLSYQVSYEALWATLRAARNHLSPGGLFVSDFWYGPAVLTQRPSERVKIVQEGADRLIRLTRPALDVEHNLVQVSFHILRLRGGEVVEEAEEEHLMRYFFRPELEFFLEQTGFAVEAFCPFAQLDGKLGEHTWNAMVVARARGVGH